MTCVVDRIVHMQNFYPLEVAVTAGNWNVVEVFLSHYKERPPAADDMVGFHKLIDIQRFCQSEAAYVGHYHDYMIQYPHYTLSILYIILYVICHTQLLVY